MIKYNISNTHFTVLLQAMGVKSYYGVIELDDSMNELERYESAIEEMAQCGLVSLKSGCMVIEKTFGGIIRAIVNSEKLILAGDTEKSALYWIGDYWIGVQRDPHRADGYQFIPFKMASEVYEWLLDCTSNGIFDEGFNFEVYSYKETGWTSHLAVIERDLDKIIQFLKGGV